jgi:hypothetical protein
VDLRQVDFAALAEEGIAAQEARARFRETVDHAVFLDGQLGVAAAGGLETALSAKTAHHPGSVGTIETDRTERGTLSG